MIGIGITGLRENFSRDRGIEEPYWRSSIQSDSCLFGHGNQNYDFIDNCHLHTKPPFLVKDRLI